MLKIGRRKRFLFCAAAGLVCGGCSYAKVKEHYHFPGVRDGRIENYYRVDIEGVVSGNQLRYASGFFDQSALNRYFNEFAQPKNMSLVSSQIPERNHEIPLAADEIREADPQGQGRRLVMLLSQNSEAIAEQIGDIAQSEALASVVSRLVFAEDIAEMEAEKIDADRMADLLRTNRASAGRLAEIVEDLNAEELKDELKNYVQQIGSALGATKLDELDLARSWLAQNESTLIGGDR